VEAARSVSELTHYDPEAGDACPSGIAVVVAREFLNNRAVLGSATKIGKRLRHFDENSAKAAGRDIVVRQEHSKPTAVWLLVAAPL
jgi:hypothetical protein